MKIIHLISGGDVGGAKTHVLSLLEGLGRTQTVRLVCFTAGAFADDAKAMGIDTLVLSPDGETLFVGNSIGGQVHAVDAETLALRTTVEGLAAPKGLAVVV